MSRESAVRFYYHSRDSLGAMTNIIFKVVVKDKVCQPLLFRAYGCSTDLFFNRDDELSYFKKLSDENFGISLLSSFPGGRLEIWREGYDVPMETGVNA